MTATTKKTTTNTIALTLLATAIAFFIIASTSSSAMASSGENNLICWVISTQTCNDPAGDCAYKQKGDSDGNGGAVCYHCSSGASLSSACISKPNSTCIAGHTPVDCGNRYKGRCDSFGLCNGNIYVGPCIVYPCLSGSGGGS